MGPRAGLSVILLLGAIVLIVAIAVGNGMGNRVLGQVAGRVPIFSTTPLPVTTPSPGSDDTKSFSWKHRQVLSVATDPAFPDPRITPEPTPEPTVPPTRKPIRRTPPPKAHPATPQPQPSRPSTTYTSPPMLYPMASGSPAVPPSGLVSPSATSPPSARPSQP